MINNDTSSIGARTVRPDKPIAQSATRDAVQVTKASVNSQVSEAAAQPVETGPSPSVSEVKVPVKNSEVDSVAGGQVGLKEEAKVLNDEQKKEVTEAISKVEAFMQDNQRTLNFEMAEKDNRVIITVIDQETKEVIRQIPPDDLVRMSDAIKNGDSLANGGILIQSKA